jgi:Uma2 family endonuclease
MGFAGCDAIVWHAPLPDHRFAEQTMAMPAVAPRRWSADDVRALPDEPGKRFECVDGELLVSPSPRLTHQSMVMLLWRALEDFARAQGIGAGFVAPGDLELDAFTLVQPDVYVLPLVDGRRPRTVAEIGHPLLFVEVLSPSTARYDRVVKRGRYQRYGVEYWIVDLDARLIERWTPDAERPEIHTEAIRWTPTGATAPLLLELSPFFVESLGEP